MLVDLPFSFIQKQMFISYKLTIYLNINVIASNRKFRSKSNVYIKLLETEDLRAATESEMSCCTNRPHKQLGTSNMLYCGPIGPASS